jgi:hypothetical protein
VSPPCTAFPASPIALAPHLIAQPAFSAAQSPHCLAPLSLPHPSRLPAHRCPARPSLPRPAPLRIPSPPHYAAPGSRCRHNAPLRPPLRPLCALSVPSLACSTPPPHRRLAAGFAPGVASPARCASLISFALLCGHAGGPRAGVDPRRYPGQATVGGACRAIQSQAGTAERHPPTKMGRA